MSHGRPLWRTGGSFGDRLGCSFVVDSDLFLLTHASCLFQLMVKTAASRGRPARSSSRSVKSKSISKPSSRGSLAGVKAKSACMSHATFRILPTRSSCSGSSESKEHKGGRLGCFQQSGGNIVHIDSLAPRGVVSDHNEKTKSPHSCQAYFGVLP